MPIQLRSGCIKEAPKRQYMSPFSIFYSERASTHRNNGLGQGQVGTKISEEWNKLKPDERRKYEHRFQELEAKYQEELILYYGGCQDDIKKIKSLSIIPLKPKRPLGPCFQYIMMKRQEFKDRNPDMEGRQLQKALINEYNELVPRQKKTYEEKYEREYSIYKRDYEAWAKKYQEKNEQLEQLLQEKMHRSANKSKEFVYQELQYKSKKKRQYQKMKIQKQCEEHKDQEKNT